MVFGEDYENKRNENECFQTKTKEILKDQKNESKEKKGNLKMVKARTTDSITVELK